MQMDIEKIAQDAISLIADRIRNLKTLNVIVAGKTGVVSGKSGYSGSYYYCINPVIFKEEGRGTSECVVACNAVIAIRLVLNRLPDILMQLYLAWNPYVKQLKQTIKNTSSWLLESFRRQPVTEEDVSYIFRHTSMYLE